MTDEFERKHKAFMRYDGNDVVSLLIHGSELQIELLAEVKRLRSVIKDFESFLYFEGFNPKEVYDEGEEE